MGNNDSSVYWNSEDRELTVAQAREIVDKILKVMKDCYVIGEVEAHKITSIIKECYLQRNFH